MASITATILLGLLILIAFDPAVQTLDARELVARSDDARAFLIADFVFVGLYAVLTPLAIWNFGGMISDESSPVWIKIAVGLLITAGIIDATEDTLLLIATGSVSDRTVDAAHALAVPKVALFLGGAALAIAAGFLAARALRAASRERGQR